MSLPPVLRSALRVLAPAAFVLLSGCAIGVELRDPAPSNAKFQKVEAPATALAFFDLRNPVAKKTFAGGRLKVETSYNDQPFDGAAWLARNVTAELVARGVPVHQTGSADSGVSLQIRTFHSENHRISGFSPFETYTTFSGDLVTRTGKHRIGFWMRAGKVPVWSMGEVVEPTYNIPLTILSREVAAKIGQNLYGSSISDAQVAALVQKIEAAGKDASFQDVYELGFGNNRNAVPALAKLARMNDEDVSAAAISSLGILQAQDQLPLLISIFERGEDWEHRAIALKAICDLGSDAAKAYVKGKEASIIKSTEDESTEFLSIIELYR